MSMSILQYSTNSSTQNHDLLCWISNLLYCIQHDSNSNFCISQLTQPGYYLIYWISRRILAPNMYASRIPIISWVGRSAHDRSNAISVTVNTHELNPQSYVIDVTITRSQNSVNTLLRLDHVNNTRAPLNHWLQSMTVYLILITSYDQFVWPLLSYDTYDAVCCACWQNNY
jgi:hypothetical protein